MTFECNFGRVNNDEIDQLQKEYSIILPDDYISFLKTYNGGVVRKSNENRVFVPDLSTHIALDVLYGVNTDSSGSDIRFWTSKFRKELLDKSIIIGDTLTQGFIVMICEGEYNGIYFWDDSYHFEESSDDENTYWIAGTFTDIVRSAF